MHINLIRSHAAYVITLLAMLYLSAKYNGFTDDVEINNNEFDKSVDYSERILRPNPNYKSLPICHPNKTSEIVTDQPDEYNVNLKKILFYTTFFKRDDFYFGFGRSPFIKTPCPVNNCFVTNNRSMLDSPAEFDAVVFHVLDLLNRTDVSLIDLDLPCRSPKQRYVMTMLEAPLAPKDFLYSRQWPRGDFPYKELSGFFNWTMTYRLDSDIPFPHGWIERKGGERLASPVRESSPPQWIKYNETEFLMTLKYRRPEFFALAKRPKLAIWVVSHCWTRSRREEYVAELRKYIDVDVMGKCGKSCGRLESNRMLDKTNDICSMVFDSDYKFYLSFENTLCHGYLTEKLWARLQFNIVPVVMGRQNFSLAMPEHSFINVEDFGSVRALAQYLMFLDSNDEAYLSYFWWRDHYKSVIRGRSINVAMCELCKMLNDGSLEEKSYDNLQEWWWERGKCTDFPKWT